jgi:hypothetical protein
VLISEEDFSHSVRLRFLKTRYLVDTELTGCLELYLRMNKILSLNNLQENDTLNFKSLPIEVKTFARKPKKWSFFFDKNAS